MWIIKILNGLNATLVKLFYSIIYGKKLIWKCWQVKFRKNFNLCIEDNGRLEIGRGCFFNNGCSISCLNYIKIGENCLFGENVKIYDHNHKFTDKTKLIKEQGFKVGEIKIGNNCWIGSNVVILNNVTIGDNVVIGSNCLIYNSIKSNSVVKNRQELLIEEIKYNL